MDTLSLPVVSVRRATPSTRIVRLGLDGAKFEYQAGQVAMLGLAGQPALVPYSIASAPEETREHGWLEFLLKMESGGWPAHFAGLRRGALMKVRGPFGSFVFPRKGAERQFLFVAGGTGIAPLRAMIVHALRVRQPGRLHLLYSARTPAEFAYRAELRRYARAGQLELALTATREIPDGWRGGRGRITYDRLAAHVESSETLCFVCGPAAMVKDVPQMLMRLGIDRSRIRLEDC